MMPGTDYIMTVQNTASVPTNVHTHGLHISGDGNADDPTRYVDAGCSLKYHWNIPSDHMGGTYWMHAHRHTTTQTQVSGGAFAMVIIEEQAGVANSVSNTVSRQNVLDWTTKELLLVASKVGSTKRGNGLTDESFDVFAGEWYRLRVAAVDPKGRRSDLVIDGCEARAVAYDGVWREQVPANAASTYSLTGASRIDLAIKCDSSGTVKFDRAVIATLNVASGSSSKPGATPFVSGGTWSPVRPDYLRDLSQEPSSLFEIYAIGMTAAQINGDSYDPDVPLRTFNYGTLQEWDISGSGAHPYHLHVYHMQVVSGCGDHEVGQYYDTISGSGSCTVRFHMTGIAERIMMHCHVLAHEDNGAMTWVDVINGGPTQSTVDREQFGCPA
jgi:FtsP/CotA-like multicopper oxidase with cupredoxin domain